MTTNNLQCLVSWLIHISIVLTLLISAIYTNLHPLTFLKYTIYHHVVKQFREYFFFSKMKVCTEYFLQTLSLKDISEMRLNKSHGIGILRQHCIQVSHHCTVEIIIAWPQELLKTTVCKQFIAASTQHFALRNTATAFLYMLKPFSFFQKQTKICFFKNL